jgi:hypothetical protein
MASTFQQRYDLPAGGTLTISLEADRPLTEAELALLTRLTGLVERSEIGRIARDG